ncbi:hypothetical protein [Sediminibacter sp. Hel_I_10]|nr:hypothetical protein [Sediminibacter sp. Hel_I_10]
MISSQCREAGSFRSTFLKMKRSSFQRHTAHPNKMPILKKEDVD